MERAAALSWIIIAAATGGCSASATVNAPQALTAFAIDTPAPVGAIVPQANRTVDGRVVLSWLEPRADKGYRFRAAIRDGETWSPPVTIDDDTSVTMFTANLPGVAVTEDGSLVAYWERVDAQAKDDPYATAIQLALSTNAGRTWSRLPSPHDDGVSGQHSFISTFADGRGLGLVWLDAQKQRHVHTAAAGTDPATDQYLGAVGLRYARLTKDGLSDESPFIDQITCECCPTAAAVTSRGPIVVYRDRVAPAGMRPEDVRYETPTVRDIHLVRFDGTGSTSPRPVHADNWTVNACPDNGPAVDAAGDSVVVAWWTAADDQPRASVAFSTDAGDRFGPAVRVDLGQAEGQVTVARVDDGAVVGWLENHQTWARWVGADGRLGGPVSLGRAPTHSRLPHWIATRDGVIAAWTVDDGQRRRLCMARLDLRAQVSETRAAHQ